MCFILGMVDADYVLELYESFWFKHSIIRGMEYSSSPPPANVDHQQKIPDEPSDLKLMAIPVKDFSPMSDNSFKLSESLSPNYVLLNQSSNPFSTKKHITEDSNQIILPKRKRSSRKIRKHKSIAELEMEEVEGFMDLGFVFTETDRRSRLASIVPGLKRMWKQEEEEDDDEIVIHQRPYLSEMWDFLEWKKKVEKPLDWRISEGTSNSEGSMKDNLKLWAQAVASLAR